MSLRKVALILTLTASSTLSSQHNRPVSSINESAVSLTVGAGKKTTSNIVASGLADTLPLKLELKNAYYDPQRNNLPCFRIAKTTAWNESAIPTLQVKKVQTVSGQPAAVIRKYYARYLGSDFKTEARSSISHTENRNHYLLIPFRLTADGSIEELLDYELTWQISPDPAAKGVSGSAFANTSVLASGQWYKIGVTQTGLHKIDKTLLTKMGLDVAQINTANIRIYGNGGKMLPERNGDFRYDDLMENAISVVTNSLGVFDDKSYIVFYATGPDEWKRNKSVSPLKFSATKNLYSDTSFYFLTTDLGPGKRVSSNSADGLSPNVSSNTYDYYGFHEENLFNFVKSGRNLYGEAMDLNPQLIFNWGEGDFVTGDTLAVEARLMARNGDSTRFTISGNGMSFYLGTGPIDPNYYLSDYGAESARTGWTYNTLPNNIGITINRVTSGALGYLDKLTINARRQIKLNAKQFQFRDTRVSGPGKICAFTAALSSSGTQPLLWNVTDALHPVVQQYNSSGTTFSYVTRCDSLNEFAIAPLSDLYVPTYVGKVANQNLHAIQQADYIVITHPSFMAAAQRLAALHQKNEGYTTAVVTVDQIYNEFSSGRQDISAIRDFIRMVYSRNFPTGKPLKYVCLMGDGSYKNKSRDLTNNSNVIPTYQSNNSLSFTNSIATDDFFGLMNANEGANADLFGIIDLGVGRLTCRTVQEANTVVSKIETYYKKETDFKIADYAPENCNANQSNMGDWRTWLMFLADDKDNALHMRDANLLTLDIETKNDLFNIDRIFLDAYQAISTPGGKRYPDAETDLERRIRKGVLVFNYTGHGGEVGLTEERIVSLQSINAYDNLNKLFLFITATCEFSRYDDPARTSAGELTLLNPKGGAVGLFSTCRLAYSTPNKTLSDSLLNYLFKKKNGQWPTLGDCIRDTKASIQQSIYYGNFHLLGDPGMRLSYPSEAVKTSEINSVAINPSSSDTLSALSKVTVKGFVSDNAGNKLSNFNGIVYPTVFDKENTQVCLVNDIKSSTSTIDIIPFQFQTQKNILYRGKSEVRNGDFTFTFLVPKDISFSPGRGRISYYATNGTTDAAGSYSNVIVGGVSKNSVNDNDGPVVDLYLNDRNFVNGGTTNEKPVLIVNLTDSSGINTAGNSIGHDISVILDGSGSSPVVLNDYYEANLNSYQSGLVRYPFSDIAEGPHTLSFKVWDIQNNSSQSETDFVVASSAELALKHVLNYPNPFTTRTKFFFEHNQACDPLKVTIQIYTISGKVVKTLQTTMTCEGYRPDGIEWDGKDDYGDKLARGVYIYRLAVLASNNKKAEKIEKLVILN